MQATRIPYDRQPVPGTSLNDLDLNLVEETLSAAYELERYMDINTPLMYLERFNGIVNDGDQLRPTIAGMIAYGYEPERWFLNNGVDIAVFSTDAINSTQAQVTQIRGPIVQVIDDTVALLHEYCTNTRMEGARLINRLDTPAIVLRELTTNALVHRDLNIESQVRIFVHPSTIEWFSPGGLAGNITIETLLTTQYSRNPTLAKFLFHTGYIEHFGMGLNTVTNALREQRLGEPEFCDDHHSFKVRVRRERRSMAQGGA